MRDLIRTLLICCILVSCDDAFARTAAPEVGVLEGAAWRLDMPKQWNHGLVVFFHGYAIEPVRFDPKQHASPMFEPMLGAGFAVLQSAYTRTGWARSRGAASPRRTSSARWTRRPSDICGGFSPRDCRRRAGLRSTSPGGRRSLRRRWIIAAST